MSNPVVHQLLTKLVHETHPEVAASLSAIDWGKIIAIVEQVLPIIINIFKTPTPTPVPAPTPTPAPSH